MKQEIINEQIQDMLNMLDETGEFPQWRLENLSKDPEALFKACLEWEGIIGFEHLKKKEEEISFLVDLLSEEQLEQFTVDMEEMNNEKG